MDHNHDHDHDDHDGHDHHHHHHHHHHHNHEHNEHEIKKIDATNTNGQIALSTVSSASSVPASPTEATTNTTDTHNQIVAVKRSKRKSFIQLMKSKIEFFYSILNLNLKLRLIIKIGVHSNGWIAFLGDCIHKVTDGLAIGAGIV
jgi:zinc transporter ZupT